MRKMIIGFYLAASQLNTRGGANAPGYYYNRLTLLADTTTS
jgi:hypothetical protein